MILQAYVAKCLKWSKHSNQSWRQHQMLGLGLKLYKAFKNSCMGIKYAFRSEWTFRLEIIILIIGIPLAFIVSHHLVERILLISSIMLVPMIELINTAIEVTINRISREYHELSGFAKDLASAAMLFAIINAAAVWGMIIFSTVF